MEKTTRITKAMRFEDIKALLNGQPVTYGTSIEDAVDFIDHEVNLLAKKNSGENKKPTKAQEENEKYKKLILEFLASQDGVTCTDIIKTVPEFAEFSNQKVSALMRQLGLAGKVVKGEVKGRAMFYLA